MLGSLGSLQDVVVVLGDDRGISDGEIERVRTLGGAVGGGGPVLSASLGAGCLLASQCIVIAHHYLDALHECPSQLWQPSAEARKRRQTRGRSRRRHNQQRKNPEGLLRTQVVASTD